MSLAFMSPEDFVAWITDWGLYTDGGYVKLNRYVCKEEKFGGADTAVDLLGKLRFMKAKSGPYTGQGPAHDTREYDLMLKGQGYIEDFMAVWNWMYHALDQVRGLKVQTYSMQNGVSTKGKVLDLAKVFGPGVDFPTGMAVLVDNGCFGLDCIGFVSQYLVNVYHLSGYPSWYSKDFIEKGGFKDVDNLGDLMPLSVVVFGNYHIAIVSDKSEVFINDQGTKLWATVTVCESYTTSASGTKVSGPMTRKNCSLTQDLVGGRWGPIKQTGILDAETNVRVGVHPGLQAIYPPFGSGFFP